ncbi:hypothetical protein VMCG_07801 [Cytospora schulzeri]|uniref:Uncharacterized protein n=1 Tax=Cytospora schulzeri TaxID=448051 RepID=A0A423VZV6_9PEZI|nr:hypothetical protein VMCG_07801 [Valsa malicola]
MDAYKNAFEAELANFANTPQELRMLRQKYRRVFVDEPGIRPEHQDPLSIFMDVVSITSRLRQIDTDNAIEGGAAKHMLDLLNRMTIPEEANMMAVRARFHLQTEVRCRKGKEMYKLIQAGWSKEAIQAKKDEVGWGPSEQFHLEYEIQEAHDRQRDLAQ